MDKLFDTLDECAECEGEGTVTFDDPRNPEGKELPCHECDGRGTDHGHRRIQEDAYMKELYDEISKEPKAVDHIMQKVGSKPMPIRQRSITGALSDNDYDTMMEIVTVLNCTRVEFIACCVEHAIAEYRTIPTTSLESPSPMSKDLSTDPKDLPF